MKETLRREDGFTLPEILVTMMIMIVVLFALYSVFDMSIRIFSFGNDKVEAVENARIGLEKMSREIRAAYPYDKGAATSDTHLFNSMGSSQITFANDLGNGDRVIDTSTEQITYYARSSANTSNPCSSAAAAPCTLYRTVGTGTAQAAVEHLTFDNRGTASTSDDVPGARFDYLKRSGTSLVATTTDSEVEMVRITLAVEKGEASQLLTTDVDMRNRY